MYNLVILINSFSFRFYYEIWVIYLNHLVMSYLTDILHGVYDILYVLFFFFNTKLLFSWKGSLYSKYTRAAHLNLLTKNTHGITILMWINKQYKCNKFDKHFVLTNLQNNWHNWHNFQKKKKSLLIAGQVFFYFSNIWFLYSATSLNNLPISK